MKFLTSFLITLFTAAAASATSIDMNLLEYTYGSSERTGVPSRSRGHLETTLRISELGFVSVELAQVYSPMIGERIILKTGEGRLNQAERADIKKIVKELQFANIIERYNQVVCLMMPDPGMTVNDLSVLRGHGVNMKLVDNAKGCFMNYSVYPEDKKLQKGVADLKSELQALAAEILADVKAEEANTILSYTFAKNIRTHNVLFGAHHLYEVNILDNGKINVKKFKSGLNRRAPILLAETTDDLDLRLELRLRGFAEVMETAELKEVSFRAMCEKVASMEDQINDLYLVNGEERVRIDSSSDCTVGYQVHPADRELAREAVAIKRTLKKLSLELTSK